MPISIDDLKKNRTLNLEAVKAVDDVIEKTGAEDKPYPVTNNEGNVAVVGNVNRVVREPQNYDIIVEVAKENCPYTVDELEAINMDEELIETGSTYRVHIQVPITEITPEKREIINSAMAMVMQLFYREVVDGDDVHYEYITNPLERQARELEILSNPYVPNVLKSAVYTLLDLPKEFQNTWVSEAVRVFVEFATNNPDLINEVDANLI